MRPMSQNSPRISSRPSGAEAAPFSSTLIDPLSSDTRVPFSVVATVPTMRMGRLWKKLGNATSAAMFVGRRVAGCAETVAAAMTKTNRSFFML